jgi:hypothetical protein
MRGLWGMLIAGLLGLVAGVWTWTRSGAEVAPSGGPPVVIHILNNGFHTDLAVPRAALEARTGPLAEACAVLGPGDWILIGWGDATLLRRHLADRRVGFSTAHGPSSGRAIPRSMMLDPAHRRPVARLSPQTVVHTLSLSAGRLRLP